MKELYYAFCSKYRKIKKPKISYPLEKTLVLSSICIKFKNEDGKIWNSWFNWKYIITLKTL